MKSRASLFLTLVFTFLIAPIIALADEMVIEPDYDLTPSTLWVKLSNSQAQAANFTVEIYARVFSGQPGEKLVAQHQISLPAAQNGVPSRHDLKIEEQYLTKVRIIADKGSSLPSAYFEYCFITGPDTSVCGTSALFRDARPILPNSNYRTDTVVDTAIEDVHTQTIFALPLETVS